MYTVTHTAHPDVHPASFSTVRLLCLFAAVTVAAALTSCADDYRTIANLDSERTTVVCFGDSITAGYGIAAEQAFPALIAKRLAMPVLNEGRTGDTTADALARLERDVFAHNPRVVVVEFGGNDFRRRISKKETLENIDRLLARITGHGAIAVVLEIRLGLLRDEYLAGYKRASKTHGALLVRDFMSGILGNPKLTVDGLHPNAEGHELIAERLMEHLVPLLEASDRLRAGKR